MTSVLPPSNSLPSVIPPTSNDISPPSPPSPPPPNSSTTTSPPPISQSNQATDSPPPSTPTTSTPPPQSPPPAVPAAPPPAQSSAPPPSPPTAPPPSPPVVTSPPPSPPVVTSPPPQNPPPSPPLVVSPPPSPPEAAPSPPSPMPPPPQVSPPPPVDVPTPPSSNFPPPPVSDPPKSAPPPPPSDTPSPPTSHSAPPPVKSSPPPLSTLSPPPPLDPTSSSPPPPTAVSPSAPPSNSSTVGSPNTSTLPSIPTEKPTAKSTNGTTVSANTSSMDSGGLNTGGAVAIGIVVAFVVLSLLAMTVWFAQKRKKKRAGLDIRYSMPSPFASSQNSDSVFLRPQSPAPLFGSGSNSGVIYSPSESGGVSNSRSWFTYEELVHATNGFSAQNMLGEGGFGCVYKGVLTDGRDIAVKQLKIGGSQGEREFRAEVEIISRVHHRHLVSLVGYCISEHQRLLVYDYVPNNTLHYHLHEEGRPVMDWALRVKVAAGAARGIAYLHEDCHPRIIHRDIKSSNILLDNNFEAQVCLFLPSCRFWARKDSVGIGLQYTCIYTCNGNLWARPLLTEALEHEDFEALVDQRLEKKYVDSEMFRMIEAAAACVRHSGAKRPRMSQVVRALDSLDESSDLTNGIKPGQSGIFNSEQHSAQIRMFQRMAFGSQEYSSDFLNQSQSSWASRDHGDRSTYIP
ncbi:hypothetical protein EZV62_015690 [Acer yangbiense]|uniref:non-specific serine/threonine protein kinase n=1 Tax=Acer yangbiense TaxID=1000413 RepID=A0A5C7HLJ0_9ROSI|nr:hypothetical protein EZV62_015690 [Acer yangbiense]